MQSSQASKGRIPEKVAPPKNKNPNQQTTKKPSKNNHTLNNLSVIILRYLVLTAA